MLGFRVYLRRRRHAVLGPGNENPGVKPTDRRLLSSSVEFCLIKIH